MLLATLNIQYGTEPLRKTEACFIAGGDPAAWLAEIASWQQPHADLRIHVVPRSAADRQPYGALVVVPGGDAAAARRCLRYGCIAGQLYLPVEARLEPDASEQELAALLSDELNYVWHPATGLVAFETNDQLEPGDFLELGPPRPRRWDRAQPGVVLSRRLVSLAPVEELSVDAVFAEGQDDIGSEQETLDELPPAPDEPKQKLFGNPGRAASGAMANVVRWFTDRAPRAAGKPTWVDSLGQWAERRLSGAGSKLQQQRERELNRLMHLLKTDPDRGLKYALPMGGGAHRGVGKPGGRLAERRVDFNLGGLGGGRAADFWDMGHFQHQLIVKYRELANREIQLGRHRRAAYIFAELLGDLDAAASTLADGRHWREAATLYRKRLNRPLDAARCYEQGGLWTEAIELYTELDQFEKAGDLHARLQQHDSAAEQYRRAVERHRARQDFLGAARLLDAKLADPDEALAVLAGGWPESQQAAGCLRETFGMLGRLGRHQGACEWVEQFRQQPDTIERDKLVADVLSAESLRYPDPAVRQTAADGTRAVAARHLRQAGRDDAQALVAAVTRLVPEDRLLRRDGGRFLQQQQEQQKKKVAKPVSLKRLPAKQKLKVAHTIHMGTGYQWKKAIASGRSIFAAGVRDGQLTAVRCNWAGAPIATPTSWRLEPGLVDAPLVFTAAPQFDRHLLVHAIGSEQPLAEQRFPATEAGAGMTVGGLRGMSTAVIGAVRAAHGATWLLELRNGKFTLIALGPQGEQLSTKTLAVAEVRSDEPDLLGVLPVPMHARGDAVYMGLGHTMLVETNAAEPQYVVFGRPIRELAGSAPNSRTRIALAFDTGGQVYWDESGGMQMEGIAGDLPHPAIGFNRGGYVIAATADRCEVYATRDRTIALEGAASGPGDEPIAVLASPRSHQFAVATADGRMVVYELG